MAQLNAALAGRSQASNSPRPARTLRSALILILVLFTFYLSRPSLAAEQGELVYFGGMAFTGSLEGAAQALPYSHDVLDEIGFLRVNQQLSAQFISRPPSQFSLDQSGLAALDGSTPATVMAATLDRETVLVEQIGNQYKLLFELAAQALFFDFRDQQVRFSYPVTIQHIDVLDRPPRDEDIRLLAAAILIGEGPATLASALAVAVETIKLPNSAARRLQLVEVSSSESVARTRPSIEKRAAAGVIGHEISKIISSELKLGLLPYRSGHAIGNVMAARFADGRVYNLIVPQPDYVIRLELEDFRGRTLRETATFRQELLGVFFRVQVEEPISQTQYMNQSMRFGDTKTIPATQKEFDEDAAYYETLLAGLGVFATAIGGQAESWVNQQPDRANMRKQLRSLQQLVGQCR